MLTRIWERLPFSGLAPHPRYVDDDPIPIPLPEAVTAHTPAVGGQDSAPASPQFHESEALLARITAERNVLAQRLQRLESMLSDPEKGQNAILYYRLRAIWDLCHRDLVILGQQFRQKYETTAPASDAGEGRMAIATRLRTANAEEKALRERLAQVRHALHQREKPYKVGEKQALTHELEALGPRLDAVQKQIAALRHEAAVTPPSKPRTGLTLATRRAVNTLLIALAQHYYLHYRDEQIAEMALRAARKPVDEVYFGLSKECLELGHKARELVALAKGEENRHETVRQRAQYLYDRLRYADDTTAIPVKESLGTIPTRLASANEVFTNFGEMIPVNVLALDYWDVSRILLR